MSKSFTYNCNYYYCICNKDLKKGLFAIVSNILIEFFLDFQGYVRLTVFVVLDVVAEVLILVAVRGFEDLTGRDVVALNVQLGTRFPTSQNARLLRNLSKKNRQTFPTETHFEIKFIFAHFSHVWNTAGGLLWALS